MAASGSLEVSVNEWREAADSLLQVAEAAAPLPSDQIGGLSLESDQPGSEGGELPLDEEIERRVDVYIEKADATVNEANVDDSIAGGLPAIIGTLELANSLMAASEDPEAAYDALGLEGGEAATLTTQRQVLDEFKEALLGRSVTGKVELPEDFGKRMEMLESKGADELLDLGKTAVLQKVVGEIATGAVNAVGGSVKEAFEWAKEMAKWLRKAAVRLLKWTLDKLRSLIPERYRDTYDDKVKEISEKITEGVQETLANALGFWAGRREAEHKWQGTADSGADMVEATAGLENVIAGHLKRIGYVGRGRVVVSGAVGALSALSWFTGGQAELVVAGAIVILMGIVWVQMVDGYNDIEGLLPPIKTG